MELLMVINITSKSLTVCQNSIVTVTKQFLKAFNCVAKKMGPSLFKNVINKFIYKSNIFHIHKKSIFFLMTYNG